jgi:hypothetical protein
VPLVTTSGCDAARIGVRLRDRRPVLTEVLQMCGECFGHAPLDLFAALSQREHAFDVWGVCSPATILSTLIYDEIVLHRSCSKPVARRIADSVPTGTVSESLPATVTERVPSALSQVSCEPDWRTLDHLAP